MRFREGQIEYFGKRGMSLLVFMLVIRGMKDFHLEMKEGITYYFYNVVVDKYSSQDSVQVLAILTAIISWIHTDFPEINKLMLDSDNASCLESHDSIPYIRHLNKSNQGICVRYWVYTEACTGKDRLDTHFSLANLIIKG